MSLFHELKRRNVFRVAAAYVVTSWLLIEVSATLKDTLHLPGWSDTLVAFFLILGFPLALFFSWAYEITPDGIRREADLEPEGSVRHLTARKLDRALLLVMAVALVYFAFEQFVMHKTGETEPAASVATSGLQLEQTAPAVKQPPQDSIAVLPFVNMSSDKEQEFFAEGLTEELLNLLASINELKVAARTSSFYYKDKLDKVPLSEVARQLDVAHVLEGSVRRSGNKIRITAQLIKADDGFHIWSKTYDRTLDDIFTIQDDIAAKVAEALKITLLGEAPKSREIDSESYDLTLQARFLYNRRLEGDLDKAKTLFKKAVSLDPNNSLAWTGLAALSIFEDNIDQASSAASKAVELDPENAEAHVRMAMVLSLQHDDKGNQREMARAYELAPENSLVLSVMSGDEWTQGHTKKSIELQKQALKTDPLHIINLMNLTSELIDTGALNEAAEQLNTLDRLAPDHPGVRSLHANWYFRKGQAQKAVDILENLPKAANSRKAMEQLELLTKAYYLSGNTSAGDRAFADFKLRYGDYWTGNTAAIYAARGDYDAAFEWLQKTQKKYPRISVGWFCGPDYNPMHSDPRWQEFMAFWKDESCDTG